MVSTRESAKPNSPDAAAAPTLPVASVSLSPSTRMSTDDDMDVEIINLLKPTANPAAGLDSPQTPTEAAAKADAVPPAEPSQDPPPGLPAGSAGGSAVDPLAQPSQPAKASSATMSATPAAATSPADAWAAFTATRVASAQEPRTKDVGVHRPSMDDLAPLLAKHAAGSLSFLDTLPIQKHDKREVVGWLHMATGQLTKSINEDAAMASLLIENHSLVKGDILVDIIKCERDLPNRILRWGIASDTALRQLQGVSLQIRLPAGPGKGKGTTMVSFPLTLPHALDGFYMDIPAGLQGQLEERLMFETLQRLEPRFLWGMYTSVSATTGLAGSRYRLHFLGSEIPSSLLQDGRMVEELIFRGRCLRVYGRGWFFRDKNWARLDLDAITAAGAPAKAPTQQPRITPEPPTKRKKMAFKDSNEWTDVRRKKSQGAVAPHVMHTPGFSKRLRGSRGALAHGLQCAQRLS
ncbi:Aste57867_17519 [Aphanomyces stellatus]|uniref:Aste57867_17519 protein n=2 Tax=Aphanomyces stellatus TaxID=120398 RepID=A0A485LBK5_9STRA|nr:hypothetical protein As57867_017459 [Aphanomyces stellatus]VFT94272.1 Aste57867_17519 [Aphanomyces stellatus]